MLEQPAGPALLGEVVERDQDQRLALAGPRQLAGAYQQRPLADALEVLLDLEGLDAAVPRQDLGEPLAQARDVPLPVADLVDQTALGRRAVDLEASQNARLARLTRRSASSTRTGCRIVATMLSAKFSASPLPCAAC
jgi:hypothetical protein